jgi:hypothetical protein
VVFDRMIPGAGTRIVYLQLGQGLLEYICSPEPGEDFSPGIDHLAFLSDDLDRDFARLLEAGASEAVAPKPAGTGVGRISFLHVGDARIELLDRDLDMRRPPRTDSLVTGLDHYTLATADPDATAAFFTDVICLAPIAETGVDDAPSRRHLGRGADTVGLITAADEQDGRRAVLRDPDGIRFELLDRPALPSAPVTA